MNDAGCLVVEIMQDPVNRDPRIKSLTDRHMRWLGHGLTAALQRAAEAGELPKSAPATMAAALRAGILGVLARARAGDIADATTLLDGLRALLRA